MHHLNHYATTMLQNTGVAPKCKVNFPWQDFPWRLPDFWSVPNNSLTAVKLSDIFRFSRQGVTLLMLEAQKLRKWPDNWWELCNWQVFWKQKLAFVHWRQQLFLLVPFYYHLQHTTQYSNGYWLVTQHTLHIIHWLALLLCRFNYILKM